MHYVPNTTIHTIEKGELGAFVVFELSKIERRSFESYTALQIRAWSIGHNGSSLGRRFYDLTVPQFSGQKAIKTLQYVPAGYLPDESKQRRKLTARGKLWWKYSFGVHHIVTGKDKIQASQIFYVYMNQDVSDCLRLRVIENGTSKTLRSTHCLVRLRP